MEDQSKFVQILLCHCILYNFFVKLQYMSLEIVKANFTHAPELQLCLQDALGIKMSHGDDIWSDKPFTAADTEEIITKGNTYVALVDDQVAASIALTWEDPRMWGEERGLDGQAGYIHRLARRNTTLARGVGRQVVSWACDTIAEAGRPYARLDCSYENRGLCALYEGQGFIEVERRLLHNPRYAMALYQKSVQ
jgi:ribosomal protein S18 acetylase RimI-like enzyme